MKFAHPNIKKVPSERLALCLILVAMLLSGAVTLAVLPKQSFSADENRVLATFPEFSIDTLLNGQFAKGIEAYVGDHFAARTFFVSLNTQAQLDIGKRDIGGNYNQTLADGGVYVGSNDHLFEVLLKPQNDIFDKNASALFEFAKKSGLPFYLLPIPSSAQEMPQLLPANAPEFDQRLLFDQLNKKTEPTISVLDIFGALKYHGTPDTDYYFKTDHHWNLYGAYQGYTLLAKAMGISPVSQSVYVFKTASDSFYGTLYSKALPMSQPHDNILLPVPKIKAKLTQQTGNITHDGLLWLENLKQKDKYTVFLGGNHSEDIIRCAGAPDRRLLVIKDSFADSLLPFLAPHFSEIRVIDPRYFNGDIYEYIRDNHIDEIAAIYSLKQLTDVDITPALK